MYEVSFGVECYFKGENKLLMASKGWTLLAEKLLKDPLTRNGRNGLKEIQNPKRSCAAAEKSRLPDTIFYKTWIQPNTDPSFASDLVSKFRPHMLAFRDLKP